MKSLFVIILILSTFAVSAQKERETPRIDIATSPVINLDSIKKAPKTQDQLKENAMPIPLVYIYKSVKYQAYQSNMGKVFIIVQSPTSKNWYRKYIKQDK